MEERDKGTVLIPKVLSYLKIIVGAVIRIIVV